MTQNDRTTLTWVPYGNGAIKIGEFVEVPVFDSDGHLSVLRARTICELHNEDIDSALAKAPPVADLQVILRRWADLAIQLENEAERFEAEANVHATRYKQLTECALQNRVRAAATRQCAADIQRWLVTRGEQMNEMPDEGRRMKRNER